MDGTSTVTTGTTSSSQTFGETEVLSDTSAYSLLVAASTTTLSTFETDGTFTRTATETYFAVEASALASLTRTITETYLGATVTASLTIYTSTATGTVAQTSVHSILITYPDARDVMYKLGTVSTNDPTLVTRLADVATTIPSWSTDRVYVTYTTALTDVFMISNTRSYTATYPLTLATTFESLTGLTVTLTRQTKLPTSIAGLYTTATYTRRDSTATTISSTLTTGFSTSLTGVFTATTNVMTRVDQSARTVQRMAGTLLTAPGSYLVTSIPVSTFRSTITIPTIEAQWSVSTSSVPSLGTSEGQTFAATWTSFGIESLGEVWSFDVYNKVGTHTSLASFAAENALIPATSLEFSNAGMGLTGIPSGWELVWNMFAISTAFQEYSAVYIPPRISSSVINNVTETYIGSSSLNSVTLKRVLSTTSSSTSFEWSYVTNSISTSNATIPTHGVVSASTIAIMRHGAYAYTNRDSTGGSTSCTTASPPEALTLAFAGQSIVEGIPFAVARNWFQQQTTYAITSPDNRLYLL